MLKKWSLIVLVLFSFNLVYAAPIIADHNAAISFFNGEVPEEWVTEAKTNLKVIYEHTSHGTQIVSGMEDLDVFMGNTGLYDFNENTRYDFPEGGYFWDEFMSFYDGSTTPRYDLSTQEETWDVETRRFLDDPANIDTNVVMWSWCQILTHNVDQGADGYLEEMEALISEYGEGGSEPRAATNPVTFIFMTGHVNGDGGESGPTYDQNQPIRDHVIANDRILFDFADIEKYDLDNNYFGDLNPADSCAYNGGNWCSEYQNSHDGSSNILNGGGWYDCDSAHSYPVNANQKAFAMWWLLAKIAGWGEETEPTCVNSSDCDDGNECTYDLCNGVGECINVPMVGASCDDGIGCTTSDMCFMDGSCSSVSLNNDMCVDNLRCAIRDCTQDGCVYAECRASKRIYEVSMAYSPTFTYEYLTFADLFKI
jgi:hypothetical protein